MALKEAHGTDYTNNEGPGTDKKSHILPLMGRKTYNRSNIDSIINIPWRANLNLYDVVFSNTPYNENEFQADFLRIKNFTHSC